MRKSKGASYRKMSCVKKEALVSNFLPSLGIGQIDNIANFFGSSLNVASTVKCSKKKALDLGLLKTPANNYIKKIMADNKVRGLRFSKDASKQQDTSSREVSLDKLDGEHNNGMPQFYSF